MIMTNIDVGSDDVNLKCKVRRSENAINPQFCDAQDMTCTLKNWHGNSPTGIVNIGFPSDHFFDQLSNSRHGTSKRKINDSTNGPELVLMPITPKGRKSEGSTSSNSDRVAALAQGFHQRFHSFGSIPIASNYPPSIEIPLRPPSIKARRNSKLAIDTGDEDNNDESNHESLTPRSKNVNDNSNGLLEKSHHSLRDVNDLSNSETSNNSESFNIPITDIIVVDTDGSHSQHQKHVRRCPQVIDAQETFQMYVTSMTSGYYEFTFYSKNAQDVMLAFLQSTLPSERITRARCEPQAMLATSPSAAIADASYDMEYLTNKEMNDILETESLSERILSKVQNFFSTFDAITSQFTQCVSCDKRTAPSSPKTFQKKEISFTDPTASDGYVLPHSRSDVPFLFSYEDSVREAPSPDVNTYISYSVVSNGDDSESHRSSFSRETDRWKKKALSPILAS